MKYSNLIFLVVLSVSMAFAEPQFNNFFGGFFSGGRGNRGRPTGNRGFGNGNRGNSGGGGGGCSRGGPNHSWGGRNYILTWEYGCNSFTGQSADAYCRRQGMRAISLNSQDKINHFVPLIGRTKYIWTGGRMNGRSVNWPQGGPTINSLWSHTGGARRPQPDNREGNESCVAVLNNFYGDGIRMHDVSCHHTKPTICEQ